MHSRFISYKHNDTILHQNWYFYNMKILHPPQSSADPCCLVEPGLWLIPWFKGSILEVAYSGSDLIVSQLLKTLFDFFTCSLMGFIVLSVHCLAVFEPLLSSRHSLMYQCPSWLCFTEFKPIRCSLLRFCSYSSHVIMDFHRHSKSRCSFLLAPNPEFVYTRSDRGGSWWGFYDGPGPLGLISRNQEIGHSWKPNSWTPTQNFGKGRLILSIVMTHWRVYKIFTMKYLNP